MGIIEENANRPDNDKRWLTSTFTATAAVINLAFISKLFRLILIKVVHYSAHHRMPSANKNVLFFYSYARKTLPGHKTGLECQ